MNRFIATLFASLALGIATVQGQSMSTAKYYYNQGKYMEAAKQLRPLADGGDAEAQYMAAMMFFEGKGVARNDAQGVKYATMAADQCYEPAIFLLVDHYKSSNPNKYFQTLKTYCDRHPYLAKKDLGLSLAVCYLEGNGTEKNEQMGWSIMENNELLKGSTYYGQYLKYKASQAGKDNLEDYADWLFGTNQAQKYKEVFDYIKSQNSDIVSYYERRASEGNGFACGGVANYYYDQDFRHKARVYLRKSLEAGSAYGRKIESKVNFEPVIYDNISGQWVYADRNNKLYILKIEHRYDKTIFHFNFNAVHAESKIWFDSGCFALCNGRKYRMISPYTRIRNPRTNARTGTDNYFTLEFEAMPTEWNIMHLGLNDRTFFDDIRHD